MKKVGFKKLPRDLQNTVVRLQRPDQDRFVFFNRLSPLYWLPVAAAAVWLFYFLFATQDYLWEEWMFWIFASVTVIVTLAAAYSITKIVASKFARLKSGFVFTPDECLKVSGGRIESWNLKEIDALRYHQDPKEIEIWSGDREERIKTTQAFDAMKLADVFDEWKASAKNGVLADHEKPEFAYSAGAKYALTAVGAVVCVLLAGAISFGAKRMNVNFDDRQTWKRIDAIGTVEEYEGYKARHPNGLYAAEAERKIGDVLAKLKDDYKAKAKKSADPNAVAALSAVLEQAARRPDRTVFVKLSETVSLDEALIKKMEEGMGVKFDPFDYSIPRTGGENRRNKMFIDIRQAFLASMGNGAIKFEASDNPPENAPVIEVKLAINSDDKEMPYFRNVHVESGHRSITYYAGAKFDFDFSMKGGDLPAYQVPYSAIPKDLGGRIVDRRDAANYSFDKVYFSSVSEGFGKFLEQVFGFSE